MTSTGVVVVVVVVVVVGVVAGVVVGVVVGVVGVVGGTGSVVTTIQPPTPFSDWYVAAITDPLELRATELQYCFPMPVCGNQVVPDVFET